MKSPLPGMDPYLEARWSDVHATLIAIIKEALQPLLPSDLRARSEERVLLEDTTDERNDASYRTDIAVVDLGRPTTRPSVAASATATMEPLRIKFYREPDVESFIQIIDVANGNRVVTVIEVLSPSNKRAGRSNSEYRKKLADYDRAQVNVVEIDLLRVPTRDLLRVTVADIPASRRTPYLICVSDLRSSSEYLAYPASLREPLPVIPIPLRPQDAPVNLALQPLIERAYVIGGHDDIDYTKPPKPPLEGEDALWAATLLQSTRR